MPKKLFRLPNKIIPISCSEKKGWREKWYEGRNMLNLPHSFRLLCIGPPDSGKSTLIKNIIIRAKPDSENIIISFWIRK
jgi:ribosome biogenesis GTPase A